MSIPDPIVKPPRTTNANTTSVKLSDADLEDLKALDDACATISKAIPEKPYILTVPVDPRFEYRHYSQTEAEGWRENTFFEPHEEHLKYMSFVYREHGESCIVAKTEVDEERERRQRLGINGASSGSSTPYAKTSAVPKKKITLGDYKSKLAGGKAPAVKEPEVEKKEHATMNGVQKEEVKAVEPVDVKPQHGQKRALEDRLEVKPPSKVLVAGSQPPPKKARTTPPPPATKSPKHETPKSNPHGLPPLQSPIRVRSVPHDLPPMLSPTLPAAIENELSRSSEKENSSAPSSAEKPRKHINEPNNKTSPTVLKLNKTLSDPEETRHHSDLSKLKELAKVEEKTHHPDQPPKKPKLVVRLKYGRKHRKEVERYLRLPSNKPRAPPVKPRREEDVKPEKPRSSEVRRVDSALEEERNAKRNLVKETPSDHVEKKATPVVRRDKEEVLKSSSEKRKRHDDEKHEQQPVKRQKGPPTLDLDKQPSTPVQPAGPSPTVASNRSSTQKTHLSATPRKDLKAVHMVRSTSTDSNTRTPQASGGTPMNLKVTSAPNGRSSEVELWLSLSRKYNDLGRKLKYQWQEIGKKKETTEQERKHAAVLAVESLLSYVLAYHCADTSARLNHRPCSLDQSWLTLIPLWKTYLRASAAYPPLEGLIYHLGVVIRSAIATILTERINLARASDEKSKDGNAPPPSRTGSHDAPTPTPSASGAQPSYPSHALVGENWTELNRCVRDASMKLSVDMLIRLFPNTWAIKVPEASKPPLGMLDRDADALITGKFWLPISTDTSPGQGVRAGLRLLEEWMDNEKVHDMELIMKKA